MYLSGHCMHYPGFHHEDHPEGCEDLRGDILPPQQPDGDPQQPNHRSLDVECVLIGVHTDVVHMVAHCLPEWTHTVSEGETGKV